MSSRPDTYRILVAGNEELGFSYCAKLLDRTLTDPRSVARESLGEIWPKDEWTKHTTVSKDGDITTLELNLELHGACLGLQAHRWRHNGRRCSRIPGGAKRRPPGDVE